MKNKFILKTLSLVLGATVIGSAFVGCGGRGVGSNGKALEITVIDKGFGTEWIEEMADLYSAEIGTYIEVIPDSNLDEGLPSKINNNPSDIYFTYNSSAQWVQWATTEKIVSLDDVISDSGFRNSSVSDLGKFDGTRYTVPFAYSPTGFVYNKVLLNKINSHGEYTKGQFPTTWQGLIDLCTATRNANLTNDYNNKVYPMAIGGGVNDLCYIFKAIWGQLDATGFKNYFLQNDPETFVKDLLVNNSSTAAIQAVKDLLGTNGINNFENWKSKDNLQAENAFCNGTAVFTVSGSWFVEEQKDLLSELSTSELDYHFAPVPTMPGKQITTYINLPGEYFMVTKDGVNGDVEEAKNFIKYLLREENVKKIHSILQVPLAYNYSSNGVELTAWGKELDNVAKTAIGLIGGSNTKVCLSGALGYDMQVNMNLISTSEGLSAQDAINNVYNTLNVNYSETARKFFS